MTRDCESIYWRSNPEWSHYDENGRLVINDDAPERAKNSYLMFKGVLPHNPAL